MSLLYIFHGGGSKNFEKRGAIDNVSASSSFIANAHNELCLLHEKKGLFEKKWANRGAATPTLPFPFEFATDFARLCGIEIF